MNISKKWQPRLSRILTSTPLRVLRHIKGSLKDGRHLWFFHQPDDPWSHLLVLVLGQLRERFDVALRPRILDGLDVVANPATEQRAHLALRDAKLLAKLYNLTFPDTDHHPSKEDTRLATRILLAAQNQDHFCRKAVNVGAALWAGDREKLNHLAGKTTLLSDEDALALLRKNREELAHKGHYNSGMLYFAGEWYWGLDRLDHLEDRLDPDSPQVYNRTWKQNGSHPGPCKFGVVDFYFSFRSPYSYLASILLQDLKDRHGFQINYKPILPMVRRGMPVPEAKRWYIVFDAKREAEKHRIPFGKICDPLDGVEHLLALTRYAREKGRLAQFVTLAMAAIWSEGMDVTNPVVLEEVCRRAGLDFEPTMIADQRWRVECEQHRTDLDALGLWGVPSFAVGDHSFWGQDRLWALERALTGSL